jgi:hypothetical protein
VTAALAAAVVVALSPSPAHFGEIVTATVHGSGTPDFAPFVVRAHHGDTYELQCLDPACVPGPGPRTVRVGGRRLVIVPRATARQVSQPSHAFERQTALPPPGYRIRPGLLEALLLAAAAVLVLVAAWLALPILRRLVPERIDSRTPLERALALSRASLGRGAGDRRRALDLLARALGRDTTARDALELAWSEPEPEPARIERLVDTIEGRT